MFKLAKRFLKDERGLELSEYAVMVALICMVIITVLLLLGPTIANKFQKLNDTIAAN